MKTFLYKTIIEFAKLQGYINYCNTSSFIDKSQHMNIPQTMRIFFKHSGISQVVRIGSKNYLCWLGFKYSQDVRFVLKFIFSNWKTKLCLCNAFPEISIYMDLNRLNENIILNCINKYIDENKSIISSQFNNNVLSYIIEICTLISKELKNRKQNI